MADARLAEAEALLRGGDPARAVSLLSAVLATPGAAPDDCRIALLLRSQAREALSDLPAAIGDLRTAIARHPHDARARNTLGILLADTGDTRGAIDEFTIAVQLDPGYARAWNNLGNALRADGRVAEAAMAARRAVAAQPDYALAWSNLGAILQDQGDESGARDAFARALAQKPDLRTIQALAGIARQRGDIDDAVDLYTRAAGLAPADTNVLLQWAGALAERDDLAASRRVYADARARHPTLLRAAFGEALTLPMVYADAAATDAARAGYAAGLARLEAEVPALLRGRNFGDVVDDLRWTNFLLAYQGEDDSDLQARFAGMAVRAIDAVAPEWRAPPRRSATGARIRVGFASAFFNDGTCGRYFRSWITGLDRARFEIFVYHLRRDPTPFLQELAPHADRIRTFMGTSLVPSAIAPAIRADALDVLVYPELGMHGTSFALAALRLAPVQCVGWGHPVTSGHPTIDVFFSCAAMEPPDAAGHYTERLVPLPGIGTTYARPAVPAAAARAPFGLPEGVPLLLCPQSLFKIHPDNDALFARVLAAAPAARLVVFEGRHPALTAKYRARLAVAFTREDVRIDERLIVLPQCGHDDYMRVNAACDAMLDTLRWSGGNTSLDALAAGLPIVTLPGRFMRGRQSAGMLALAGIDGLVAGDQDDYVGIAARLALDPAWRVARAADIRVAAGRLFDDPEPVRALSGVFEALVHGDARVTLDASVR
jgi:predicted O-linked N-acetylglucosamine transferase (SPINDLY family)